MLRLSAITLALIVLALPLAAQKGSLPFRDAVFAGQVGITKAIPYGHAWNPWSGAWETLALDLYEPLADDGLARPAMVMVPGGDFLSASRGDAEVVALATAFAERGYAVVVIDHRRAIKSSQLATFRDQVIEDAAEDFKAAVRFLRAEALTYRVDPTRIGAVGSSAGATTILTAAYAAPEGSSGHQGWSSRVDVLIALWGQLHLPSVIDAGEAPVFLVHGTNDKTVPAAASDVVLTSARAVGIASEMRLIDGAGHDAHGPFLAEHLDAALAFSWRHLELGALQGLHVTGTMRAGGTIQLEASGVGGDLRWLAIAPKTAAPIVFPEVGTLHLPLELTLLLEMPGLAGDDAITSSFLSLSIPDEAVGLSFHLQELHVDASGTEMALTNLVTLSF